MKGINLKAAHISHNLVFMAIFFSLAVNVLANTALSPEGPEWINNTAVEYPSTEFIVGVGAGESAEVAVEAARADLAAGFRASIHSIKQVDDDVSETFGSEGGAFERTTRTRSSTEVEANENLANITLGGTWHDPATDKYHALVYIKRKEAEQTIGADIQNSLIGIGELLDCDACYADVVAEYAGAVEAMMLLRKYQEQSAQMRVVSEGRAGAVDPGLGARVATWLSATGSRLTLNVTSTPENLAQSLREALLQAGFVVVDGPSIFTAELAYSTRPTTYQDPFVFERWEMSLRIRSTTDGAEVVTLNKQDRAGHKSREAAQERCLRKARNVLSEEFEVELEAFLTGRH